MHVLNIHNVLHVVDDVIARGCSLIQTNAFPFESFLGKLKNLIRTPFRPLSQVCRRLHEIFLTDPQKPQKPYRIEIFKSLGDNIWKLRYKQCILTTERPDNFVMLRNKTLLKISKISRTASGIEIMGQLWKNKRPIFNYPGNSSLLYMWELYQQSENRIINCNINEIKAKMIFLSLNFEIDKPERVFTLPLLHH